METDLLGFPQRPAREQLLTTMWQRTFTHVSCDQHTGYLLRSTTRTVPIPPTRPSDPENVRHENCVELRFEFSEPSTYAEQYKNIFPKRKADHLLELISSADTYLNSARSFGLEVLQYCEEVRDALKKKFGVKNTDESPDINNDEYAHYELLAVFIVERQLGITKAGLMPLDGPVIGGERYVGLTLHSNGCLWYGPSSKLEASRTFIDQLILKSDKAQAFIPRLAQIKQQGANINLQLGTEVSRVKEAAEKTERERQSSDTKVDRIMKKIKNNTVMAGIIVVATVILAVVGFYTAVMAVLPIAQK
jgi:hypothetical protein